MKMIRMSSAVIQLLLIFLNIPAVLPANGTPSNAASSSTKNSKNDGLILAEQIQTKITKKLSTFSKILHIKEDAHTLLDSLKDLHFGADSEKKKLEPVKRQHKKMMRIIDEICTMLKIWSSGSIDQNEESGWLAHIAKKVEELRNELIPLANMTNGLYPWQSSPRQISGNTLFLKSIFT